MSDMLTWKKLVAEHLTERIICTPLSIWIIKQLTTSMYVLYQRVQASAVTSVEFVYFY